MENKTDVAQDPAASREQAQERLVELTGEYYTLRTQLQTLTSQGSSQKDSRGQMRSVLMVDRLDEIVQETKRLLPLVYPQLDQKTPKAPSHPPHS